MAAKPNAIVAQSGGPTTVINASACGVIQEAMKSGKIGKVIGATNGILGVLKEDLFNISAEKPETIAGLKSSPAAAIGSCRYKLKKMEESKADFQRVVDVFKAHNIRYFFYAGGNDSMDTADKVNKLAAEELRLGLHGHPQNRRQRPGLHRPLPGLPQRRQVCRRQRHGGRP